MSTADALDAGLLQYSDGAFIGTRRLDRDARPDGSGVRHVLPIVDAEDLAEVPIEERDGRHILRLGDVADLVTRPPAADRRRRHQRRPRPDADRREAALGQHAGRHRGVEAALDELRARAARDRDRLRRSSGPATFIEDVDRQPEHAR